MSISPIRQILSLGTQWPTLDPFLFCAHHLDSYPPSNGKLGPNQPLTGRSIGQDFDGIDGWNMYHGSSVPGFPQHPHRGFETVTYVRTGFCDHSDSLGAKARFGDGDVQWLTAGSGILHSEMFPLLNPEEPNPLHLFQIWLNLPASNKMVDPYFSMYWNSEIPKVSFGDPGQSVSVTVIAGSLDGVSAVEPPPDSWASRADSNVAIWHVTMDANSSWTIPPCDPTANRVIYAFEGRTLVLANQAIAQGSGVVVDPAQPIDLETGKQRSEVLVLQGTPISEPIAQYGPFVMNSTAEIEQAVRDYQTTKFGGWPWPTEDPTHGPLSQRFAETM